MPSTSISLHRRHALSISLTTLLATLIFSIFTSSPGALAHKVGLSRVSVTTDGPHVLVTIGLARSELSDAFPSLTLPTQPSDDSPASADSPLLNALSGGAQVAMADASCRGQSHSFNLDGNKNDEDAPGLTLSLAFVCPTSVDDSRITVNLPWLGSLGSSHRSVVAISSQAQAARTQSFVVTAAQSSFSFDRDSGEGGDGDGSNPEHRVHASAFLGLGIEHILIGADHLLFLFALVLLRARRRDLLLLVSAFTLAHSLTLSASALGWLALPSSIVEPIIALSVALVGVENLLTGRFAPDMSKRWRLTFVFGLVHGFGFASVLADIGLPAQSTTLALLLFNVGVEFGQLMVLALVLPLLWLLRHPVSDRIFGARWFDDKGVRFLSAGVVIVGLLWLIERVV